MACLISLAAHQPAYAADDLCDLLRGFASSVKPGEKRALNFHTIWGSNFKDRDQPAPGAKRCDYASYAPGKALCVHLMQVGSIHSPGDNAKQAIKCFSKKTQFDIYVNVLSISASLPYGKKGRGTRIDIDLRQHAELGGMVLTISAEAF
jgi:hypothetical protein